MCASTYNLPIKRKDMNKLSLSTLNGMDKFGHGLSIYKYYVTLSIAKISPVNIIFSDDK